ncbi:MAG: AbrB/MazE/SpoVT family DNA-binding domain-containing protein [Thermoanaerobaculia bacterium]
MVRTGFGVRTNMSKRLVRTGNSLSLILDRPLLEQTGIDENTDLEISTDGDVVIISPVRTSARNRKLKRAVDEINDRYAGVFRRLAE